MADREVNKKYIDDYKKDYEYYTGKASEINRNLALAGIAIVWIFKTTSGSDFSLPKELTIPLLWLVISLSLDFLQYVLGGLIWFVYYRYYEKQIDSKKIKRNKDLKAPVILPGILHIIYWAKLVSNILAYTFIFKFIYSQLIK